MRYVLLGLAISAAIFLITSLWARWAFFGNDEDGPYGIYPHTAFGAVRWWLRNPAHNFCFHVINWPGGPFLKFGDSRGWNGYIGFRPPNGVFGIALRHETKEHP